MLAHFSKKPLFHWQSALKYKSSRLLCETTSCAVFAHSWADLRDEARHSICPLSTAALNSIARLQPRSRFLCLVFVPSPPFPSSSSSPSRLSRGKRHCWFFFRRTFQAIRSGGKREKNISRNGGLTLELTPSLGEWQPILLPFFREMSGEKQR